LPSKREEFFEAYVREEPVIILEFMRAGMAKEGPPSPFHLGRIALLRVVGLETVSEEGIFDEDGSDSSKVASGIG
jgi:hypothetical protein